MNLKHSISIAFSAVVTLSCNTAIVSPSEFAQWCGNAENGLVKVRDLGSMEFRLEYWPTQLVQLQSESGDPASHQGMEYFRFHIEDKNAIQTDLLRTLTGNNEEYQSLSQFLAFHFGDGIHLQVGAHRLPCVHYHFERNYGLRPGIDLVFAFENTDPDFQHDRKLEIVDDIFGTGRLHFSFNREHIQQAQQHTILSGHDEKNS